MTRLASVRGFQQVIAAAPHSGWLPPHAAEPAPLPPRRRLLDLDIEATDSGCLLLWRVAEHDSQRRAGEATEGDYWAPDLAAAKEQAAASFGVPATAWVDAPAE